MPINKKPAKVFRMFGGERYTLSSDIGGVPAVYDGVPKRFANSIVKEAREQGYRTRLVERRGGGYLVYIRKSRR